MQATVTDNANTLDNVNNDTHNTNNASAPIDVNNLHLAKDTNNAQRDVAWTYTTMFGTPKMATATAPIHLTVCTQPLRYVDAEGGVPI